MANVQAVPLFTWKALTSFVSKSDDDYERSPLLVLGSAALLASKVESMAGYDWGHVVQLENLGNKLCDLTDYWDLVELLNAVKKSLSSLGQIHMNKEAAKDVVLFASKAFSCAVGLGEALHSAKVLSDFRLDHWKLRGSLIGSIYSVHKLYSSFNSRVDYSAVVDKDEDCKRTKIIKKSFTHLSKEDQVAIEAKEGWREFHTVLTSAVFLGIKIIGIAATFQALKEGAGVFKWIAANKNDLLLASYVTLTASDVGSHFLFEQMVEIASPNKVGIYK